MFRFLNNRGFTLAELMAVVAIIGILAGLGIGSYRRSIDRTRFTEAKSMAHQVAAARDAYYYDHMGFGSVSMPMMLNLLPIEVENSSGSVCSGSSCTMKNFTLYINNSAYVRVIDKDRHFGLCVYQEAVSGGATREEKCLALDAEGQEMCQMMGYSSYSSVC